MKQLVTFTVSEEEFAVDIMLVQEVIRLPEITPVPNAPDFVEGVIHLRGRIIPVIDLRKRLRISGKTISPYNKFTRVIIVVLQGRWTGFIVDAVTEILKVDESDIQPTPELVMKQTGAEYFEGVVKLGDRLMILLNIPEILKPYEKDQLRELDLESIKKLLLQSEQ